MTGLNELRQRLLHPYYVLHLAYGLSYVVTRSNQLMGQSFNLEVRSRKKKVTRFEKLTFFGYYY